MTSSNHRLLRHRADLLTGKYPVLTSLSSSMVSDPDESHQVLFDLILDVFEHDHLVDGAEYGDLWSDVVKAVGAAHRSHEVVRDAIAVNMLGLIALGRPRDYRDLVFLIDVAGHETVASIHSQIDRMAQTVSGLPWTTELIHRLCSPGTHLRNETTGRISPDLASGELAVCTEAATALLLHGVDESALDTIDPILTGGGFKQLVEHGNAHQWRQHLAAVAADPWGENATRLTDLARTTGLPGVAAILDRCIQHFRTATEVDERRVIANRVRELVKISGLSQRAFAARVGTSASRMSTYVNGQVTPSAAMLLRMTRAAAVAVEVEELELLACS